VQKKYAHDMRLLMQSCFAIRLTKCSGFLLFGICSTPVAIVTNDFPHLYKVSDWIINLYKFFI
jgi:hypothetical protein